MPLGTELCVVGVTPVRSAARDARAASQGQSGGLVGWPARRCERCGQFPLLDHQPVPLSDHTLAAEIHLAKPSSPPNTPLPSGKRKSAPCRSSPRTRSEEKHWHAFKATQVFQAVAGVTEAIDYMIKFGPRTNQGTQDCFWR